MKTIAILTGGESSEREIALRSAASVFDWVTSVFDDVRTYDFPSDIPRFLDEYKQFDLAVPVFHGRGGEDGTVQGFLKTLGIPFLFSDVGSHALGMEKAWTKSVVARVGVPTANWKTFHRGDSVFYERPSVIKVPDAGSSVGVFLGLDSSTFEQGIKKAFSLSEDILVEDFIQGREFTVPIVESLGALKALPVIEIRSKNAFFDLESKYDPALAEELCPAPIEDALRERLQHFALLAHQTIGVKQLSRSDFIVDTDNGIWFLEINTIPGMTKTSLLPKAVQVAGFDMPTLFAGWIASCKNGSVNGAV